MISKAKAQAMASRSIRSIAKAMRLVLAAPAIAFGEALGRSHGSESRGPFGLDLSLRADGNGALPGRHLRLLLGLVLGVAVTAGLLASAFASSGHIYTSSFGTSGTAESQFGSSSPTGAALDQSSGDLYVADTANHRIERFQADGTFVSAWGWGVSDGSSAYQVCTSSCQAGISGSGAGQFNAPAFIAVDGDASSASFHDVYVADTATGLVQKFDSSGNLITGWGSGGQLDGSTATDGPFGPIAGIAVDASGNLDVFDTNTRLFKFAQDGSFTTDFTTARGTDNKGLAVNSTGNFFKVNGDDSVEQFQSDGTDVGQVTNSSSATGIAVDPATDDLYVDVGSSAQRYHFNGSGQVVQADSTTCAPASFSGCNPTETFGSGHITAGIGLAVRGLTNRVYVSDAGNTQVDVFDFLTLPDVTTGAADNLTQTSATLHGTVNPSGVALTGCHFDYGTSTSYGQTAPCVPAAASIDPNGGVQAVHADLSGLAPNATYHFRLVAANANGSVDGSDQSFVTLGLPDTVTLPVGPVTETTAVIGGTVDPNNAPTTYYVEYADNPAFTGSTSLPATRDADAGSGPDPVPASRLATGLTPDTTYFYRVVAHNAVGDATGQARSFRTDAPAGPPQACPNAQLRQQNNSTDLPDCRAYELVTPPDTGSTPIGPPDSMGAGGFPVSLASTSAGSPSAIFSSLAGSLPGIPGGIGNRDRYRSLRGPGGWTTSLIDPPPGQAQAFDASFFSPSGFSSDQQFAFFAGTTDTSQRKYYLRYPDGHYEPIGIGSLGVNPSACGVYISPGASHVLFSALGSAEDCFGGRPVQLEPDAPPSGTNAIYDRSPGGPTHVVSLLPDSACATPPCTPAAGQNAFYKGVSADGSLLAFKLGSTSTDAEPSSPLYLRLNDAATQVAAPAPNTFAGLSANDRYLFYADAQSNGRLSQTPADLFSFDTADQTTTQITDVGDALFVNVSRDGSHVYFVSHHQIAGQGAEGRPNLYLWDRATGDTTFVATVAPADLTPTDFNHPACLACWTSQAVARTSDLVTIGPGNELSRSTPDGRFLAFASKAQLTAYDNQGHTEIYRYGAADGSLVCVSCGPGGQPPTSDASLQTTQFLPQIWPLYVLDDLTVDGQRLFFQTSDPLVPRDTAGSQDVYEWEADGAGDCSRAAGCVSLISDGQSPLVKFTNPETGQEEIHPTNLLYSVSPDGRDVFIQTRSQLLPQDASGGAGAIYDARVDGGFPQPPAPAPCVGDACQGNPTPPPAEPGSGSSAFSGPGNQGKSRGGSTTAPTKKKCKKRHHRKTKCKRSRRANANRGGAK